MTGAKLVSSKIPTFKLAYNNAELLKVNNMLSDQNISHVIK